MQSLSKQILLVEDFKPYRSSTVRLLSHNPDLKVISEAEDGSDAVARATQLRPDLILMDIGLPKLNGLEAARRIRELLPAAKIIFLTQETDVNHTEELNRNVAVIPSIETSCSSTSDFLRLLSIQRK